MGQDFYLISIDTREYTGCARLTESLGSGEAELLPYKLARPKIRPRRSPTNDQESCPLDFESQQGTLACMPEELLLSIFEYADRRSTLCLSLTCERLWEIGWPYYQKRMVGSWRGTRIICEGDENQPVHPPPDMLTQNELEVFSAGLDEEDFENDTFYEHEDPTPGPTTLALWMHARGQEIRMLSLADYSMYDLFSSFSCPLPASERKQAANFICGSKLHASYAPNENWTLRNMTKKVFVQGKKLNAAFHLHEPTTGLDLPCPSFADALLSRIAWSSSESSSFGLNRGEWAGHRFELLTDEDHLQAIDGSWTDDSDEVIQTLAKKLHLAVFTDQQTDSDIDKLHLKRKRSRCD